MSVNNRIRIARNDQGLSLNALAKRIGVTSTCVWNWDHDNTSPRADALLRVADALNVSVEWLRDGKQSGSVSEAQTKPDTLDLILADARHRVAGLLGIDANRVKLTLAFDDGAVDGSTPTWLANARHLVGQLSSAPMSSSALIAERREAAQRGE